MTGKIFPESDNIYQDQAKILFNYYLRDYRVNKLGVIYIPVADQLKYEDKSFIVDYTGQVAPAEVTLQLPRQKELLVDTIHELKELSTHAPVVESWQVRPFATHHVLLHGRLGYHFGIIATCGR
ncbi:MAG: hypothetical protein LBM06_06895 [Prevotellaceae bacterium]|nr:hypothetical protein [Prevotellaceae bacterium]